MAPRPDAVMYCFSALEKFAKMSPAEVQRIAFEIAMKGRTSLDTNDPAKKYELKKEAEGHKTAQDRARQRVKDIGSKDIAKT